MTGMIYGPMMTRHHLIGNAQVAFSPLFEAYAVQRERGTRWRAEIEKAVPAIQLQTSFDQFQHVGMFAIAASIALLADNIARVYAHDKLGHGGQRQAHGREIAPGITFGKVL